MFDQELLHSLRLMTPDRDRAIRKAYRDRVVIVESDAHIEDLNLSWGQIKTLVEGTMVTGDTEAIDRLIEIRSSAARIMRGIIREVEPQLQADSDGELVEADPTLDVPGRAMDFLVRAIAHGAPPHHIRHLVGGYLAHHAYQWLWVPYTFKFVWELGIDDCLDGGDGELLVSAILASMDK